MQPGRLDVQDIAAVADHDRVVTPGRKGLEPVADLAAHALGIDRNLVAVQRCLDLRLGLVLDLAQLVPPAREVELRALRLDLGGERLERAGEIAHERDVGLAVLTDQGRVHVELDDLAVRGDRLTEAHPEVEERARENDQVDLLERVPARAVQELRRIRRDRAATHAVRVGGHVGVGDELVHRLGRVGPLHARPGHQHRALRVLEQLDRLRDLVLIR